jgi:hypothetical protein
MRDPLSVRAKAVEDKVIEVWKDNKKEASESVGLILFALSNDLSLDDLFRIEASYVKYDKKTYQNAIKITRNIRDDMRTAYDDGNLNNNEFRVLAESYGSSPDSFYMIEMITARGIMARDNQRLHQSAPTQAYDKVVQPSGPSEGPKD